MRRKVIKYLYLFFTWVERTFTPRRYATKQAIEASRRAARTVPDVRSGPGGREAVAKVLKFNNSLKGSRFIKQRPANWTPKTDK